MLLVVESRPVFVDPTGRRRRVLRRTGMGAVAVLVGCLGAVVVALAGGPQAPFTHWAVPRPAAAAPPGHVQSRVPAPGGRSHPDPQAGAGPSPRPSPRPGASVAPSASSSPSSSAPTNPAGRTPPGKTRSPNPHKTSHGP